MIKTIILSRDRAPELKLLIESIEKLAPDFNNIKVLYSYELEETKKGYQKLIEEAPKNIEFVNFLDLKEEMVKTLSEIDEPYVVFFTDNNVFYREFQFNPIINYLNENQNEVFCFSLRLGKNITYCQRLSATNKMHDIKDEGENIISWDWYKHYMDFGFPFSMNGHIFRTNEIKKMIKKVKFLSPVGLEGELESSFDTFPKTRMASFEHSVSVETELPENAGLINRYYLMGHDIDYNTLDFSDVKSTPHKTEFKLKKLENQEKALEDEKQSN